MSWSNEKLWGLTKFGEYTIVPGGTDGSVGLPKPASSVIIPKGERLNNIKLKLIT